MAGWTHSPGGGQSLARFWPRKAGSPPGLAREGSVQSWSLSTPASWKAPHVQAPRSRLCRFPAMNWASESEPPAGLRAESGARGAGDGRRPRSARLARVHSSQRSPFCTVTLGRGRSPLTPLASQCPAQRSAPSLSRLPLVRLCEGLSARGRGMVEMLSCWGRRAPGRFGTL